MSKKLDFKMLEESDRREWSRRDANSVVQMSLRMPRDLYEEFRDLCRRERRTNGDQLRVLLKVYLEAEKRAKAAGKTTGSLSDFIFSE